MAAFDYQPTRLLALARRVLATEAAAISALQDRLGDDFLRAVQIVLACKGRVVVSGIGKSGHVARKIASTLASTGTPAFFVHAAEAIHGDLGMITREDVVIALSNSGESAELLAIVPLIKRQGAQLIALTGDKDSSLARHADARLDAAVDTEACPLGLAPTASTSAALALGDALALALLDARGFSADDFARSHPGGALGRRLLTHVRDVMRHGPDIPQVPATATLADAVLEMSGKGLGLTVVVNPDATIEGIFTDGDLRRSLGQFTDLRAAAVTQFMSRHPRLIGPDRLAVEAVEVMETGRPVMALLVIDSDSKLVGVLHMHDLIRARVI
ncbi:MAG: KpsF/GutQ family sugar-phosphate isomerase [Betaproteobacteria bacterium]